MFLCLTKWWVTFVTVICCCGINITIATITTSQQNGNNNSLNQFQNSHPMLKNPSQQESPENEAGRFHMNSEGDEDDHGNEHQGSHGIRLASWRWKEYWEHILLCLIIIMAGIFKLAFHHTPVLSTYLPESCVLIIIGIISGCFIYYGINSEEYPFPQFTSHLFFNYLLPPIVLDSAYSLYDRDFLYNIGSIIVFAVIGTLFNVFTVGFGLYFINYVSKY